MDWEPKLNIYAIMNGINSICGLLIAAIILFKRGQKPVQITYGLFSLLLFFWASFYFMWGVQTSKQSALFWLYLLEFPVCFIHSAYFHFTLVFCDKTKQYKKLLAVSYVLSAILALIHSQTGFYDLSHVRNLHPFMFWPHARPLLFFLISTEVFFVSLSYYIMYQSIKNAPPSAKTRYMLFLITGIIGWTGGITNWFMFYDSTPIPPIGNPGITLYLLFTFYFIFRHDLLGLNLAVKRTFVYAFLTLAISLVYALFVTISERFFQTYIGYSSIIGTILAAFTIALFFNPVRNFFGRIVDKQFYGKSIAELSTENLLMKLELEKKDKMKAVSTLAAGMAHEIKNPLTAIKTFAEYLPKKYDDPEFRDKFSRIIVDEVDRVNNIVKQLLEFSKPSDPNLRPTLISELLDQTVSLLNDNMLKYKIELSKQFDPYAMVLADRNQLKQAFLNLFLNSIQSMKDGGKLSITARGEPDGQVKVTISDTGCGVPTEQLAHVFDPFYTTKEDGTGLGLAIVHGIITKHGGKIQMESAVGKGTTVNVFLKSQS